MPLQFSLIVGGLGVVFLWMSKREKLVRVGRIMVTAAMLVLALASNRGIALRLAHPLESLHPPIPKLPLALDPAAPANPAPAPLPPQLAACKYVLVLGSGHGDAPARSRITQLSNSGRARLTGGIRILNALPPGAKLVTSGLGSNRSLPDGQKLAQVIGVTD